MSDADCAENIAELIIDGRFVGSELFHTLACLNRLVTYICFTCAYSYLFRFRAGKVIAVAFIRTRGIPYVKMILTVNITLGLMDYVCERVIYKHVSTIQPLEPQHIGNCVYRCNQRIFVKPQIKFIFHLFNKFNRSVLKQLALLY